MDTRNTINVEFTDRTHLDEPANHLTLLFREAREELVLPDSVVTGDAWFFDVYYTRTNEEDFTISAALVRGEDSDVVFVDLNNDEDLTNDGQPLVIERRENSFSFEIVSPRDHRQRTKYRLQRVPLWITEDKKAKTIDHFLDEKGNLRKEPASFFGMGRTGFATQAGLFFFDCRIGLARGQLPTERGAVSIGIFDYDNDGLFDGPDDLVVVDLDDDGKLAVLMSVEAHHFDEAFLVDDTWYRLVKADPYGTGAQFEIVAPPAEASYWLNEERNHATVERVREGNLSSDFWAAEFRDVSDTPIRIEDYRGDFLLLNFWGEWCKPCIEEIPVLVAAASRFESRGLKIISFLESKAPDRANEILGSFDAEWPQVMLTDDLKKRFRVGLFPTNLLILPDGSTYVRTTAVTESFFESFMEESELSF